MTCERQQINVPPTVQAYLTQPAYRTGVDALLAYTPAELPPEEAFERLGDYYAARAAAELTRYDYARIGHELWSRVWGSLLSGWAIADQDTLDHAEIDFSPEALWKRDGFTHCHKRGGFWLYTSVAIREQMTEIAFSIENKRGATSHACPSFQWRNDEDWVDWLVHRQARSIADAAFDFGQIIEAASVGYAHALEAAT